MKPKKFHHDPAARPGSGFQKVRKRACCGYSAVEMAMSMSLFLFIVSGTCVVVNQAGDTWCSVVERTTLQAQSSDTMQKITGDLKNARDITIDESDPTADVVTFQIPIKVEDGKVTWGAYKYTIEDGKAKYKPKKGYWVQYRMVSKVNKNGKIRKMLVRRILDKDKAKTGDDELIAKKMNCSGGSQKSFRVTRTGDLMAVSLRLRNMDKKKTEPKIRLRSSVHRRNWSDTSNDADSD